MSSNHDPILLIDGHNLLFRSFTILPRSITGPDDQPINGAYGLFGQIRRLVAELSPVHVVVAFDVPEVPTFRRDLYQPYQAQRGPMGGVHADDFVRQTEIAQAVLPAVGIAVVLAPGFEADDVMGTLAVQTKDFGSTAIIVSTDRDLSQLVQENIEVYVPGKVPLRIQDGASVFDRMGVHPTGITTFKALAGDASDNIPGVRGIGSRTASSLVNRYQTLEEIFRSLSQLPTRVSGALQSQREEAFLFRELVTVRTDVDLPMWASKLPILNLDSKISIRDLLENSWHW